MSDLIHLQLALRPHYEFNGVTYMHAYVVARQFHKHHAIHKTFRDFTPPYHTDTWTISHIPSGLRVIELSDKDEAIQVAEDTIATGIDTSSEASVRGDPERKKICDGIIRNALT